MIVVISPLDERKRGNARFAMYKRDDGQFVITNTMTSAPCDPFTGNPQTLQFLGPVSKPHNKSIVTRECDKCQTAASSDALVTHCAECGLPYT